MCTALLKRCCWLWLLVLPLSALADGRLVPFTSDGCSEFPDGTLQQKDLWLHCCVAHDRAYWLGGTYEEREAADETLELCVAEVGEPAIAKLMLAGVRVGGSPYWPTRFRWGYGWRYLDGWWPRGYRVLSAEELRQARELDALDDEKSVEKSLP